MKFTIKKHLLQNVPFVEANAYDRKSVIKPTLILTHDTAGPLTPGNCVAFFDMEHCKTSAHIVVERDGSVTQMVPFNRRAFHAGVSSYKGRKDCNQFSIGIEIVNPGCLDRKGKAWFHKEHDAGFDMGDLVRKKTKEHGDGVWMQYTPEQIETVTALCKALAAAYPIEDITTHWFVSPKRKVDPNPLFPLEEVRNAALSETERAPAEIYQFPVQEPPSVPDVVPTAKPHQIAAQGSRSMSWVQRLKLFFGFGGISGAGLLTADNLSMTKGYVNEIANLFRDNAATLLVVGCLGGLVIGCLISHYILEAHSDGRYRPRDGLEGDGEPV
jgi:N-acetylmuramoyl-L-alanine amidase